MSGSEALRNSECVRRRGRQKPQPLATSCINKFFDHGKHCRRRGFCNGKIVSVASNQRANSISTMVVGVATAEGSRGRGYASAAVYELCRRSFADGKRFICLFYDNPDAGRIYRRLGFAELGEYAMIR